MFSFEKFNFRTLKVLDKNKLSFDTDIVFD